MSYRKVCESNNQDYLAESTERLRRIFPQGSTVSTVIINVTSSGMGRTIKVLASGPDGISNVSSDVARVLGWRIDTDRGGVYVTGCGMDMAFHLVYTLAQTLYQDGYSLNQRHI